MTADLNIEQIKTLLARFYEGKTSPEEERQLALFFRGNDVPKQLQQDKQLFLMLAEVSEQEMPQDVQKQITAFVNNLGQEDNEKPVSVSKRNRGAFSLLKMPPKIVRRVAAAVAILLAAGSGMLIYQQRTSPFRDTCATPEEAAEAILYANSILVRSSEQFTQSTDMASEQIAGMNETIKKATGYINQ